MALARALVVLVCLLAFGARAYATLPSPDDSGPRTHLTLTSDWLTRYAPTGTPDPVDLHAPTVADAAAWRAVEAPHGWDTYGGYAQTKHGQLHGTAWYRRTFTLDTATLAAVARDEQRVFLLFEGVGSYATVWLNGREVGRHAGGLTTFTLDATAALHADATRPQLLAVRAEHPTGIRDLPWVCGGCERAYGFSEGSQPFGLNRPVHVVTTNPLRIAPFGVHVWNDRSVTPASATAQTRTELANHAATPRTFLLRQTLLAPDGTVVTSTTTAPHTLAPGATATLKSTPLTAAPAQLWSLTTPTLYTLRTELLSTDATSVPSSTLNAQLSTFPRPPPPPPAAAPPSSAPLAAIDSVDTPFGFRWIDWPHGDDLARGTFLLNGEPVFLNGTCEYQHLLGGGHAFSSAQITARVRQMQAAGFNAFRDAHHPHDLRYHQHWDRDGLAWWTQFGAQIWFDRDDFRANYLTLLRDWVKERRNSPSLVLWGLQNESKLPPAFAAEATALIRALDPTCGDQRLVTTCNGGTGTDWDVPQNWTGTYGGDPATYADDLRRQILIGEYGAWRSAGLYEAASVGRPLRPADAPPLPGYDEDTFTALLETKVRLAHAARDASAGHFQWIFTTHDNPGRHFGSRGEQLADGWAPLDRVGAANNKGLLTTWGEPLDAFYMYRSNFAPPDRQPMVVIAGANWPDRVIAPGPVDGLIAYSNADEVELFNGPTSLGTRTRAGVGTHFRWDGVTLRHRELRAEARRAGRLVATDAIELPLLPAAGSAERSTLNVQRPTLNSTATAARSASPAPNSSTSATLNAPAAAAGAWQPLHRLNCGGPAYVDHTGALWSADPGFIPPPLDAATPPALNSQLPTLNASAGAASTAPTEVRSWSDAYPHLPPALASAGRIHLPIAGTPDPALYQTFRYGRSDLAFRFAVPDGPVRVQLHFAEPWYGRGGIDATGWRLFDVALNGITVHRDLDLFARAGFATAHVETFETTVTGGRLTVSFPRVTSYQAVISAITVATPGVAHTTATAAPSPAPTLVTDLVGAQWDAWLDLGAPLLRGTETRLARPPAALCHQPVLRRTTTAPAPLAFTVTRDVELYAVLPAHAAPSPRLANDAPPSAGTPDWEPTHDALTTTSPVQPTLPLHRRVARAGERLTFDAVTAPVLVFIVPTRPLAPARSIRDLRVENSAAPAAWRAAGALALGARLHGPDGPALTQLPSELTDADWLVTPATESSPDLRVSLTAADPLEVTIALDATSASATTLPTSSRGESGATASPVQPSTTTTPPWLADWLPLPAASTATLGDRSLALFRRRFDLGASITLGAPPATPDGSPAPVYAVFARPTRAAAVYAAPPAPLTSAEPAHTWTIEVGVGDRYGLVIPVRSDLSTATPAASPTSPRLRAEFLDRDGATRCTYEEDLATLRTESDGWPRWRLRTCTSVNAGTYHVRVTLLSNETPVILGPLTVE